MTRGDVKEYLEAIRERYQRAKRKEKSRILMRRSKSPGIIVKPWSGHCGPNRPEAPPKKRAGPSSTGQEAVAALKTVWDASDRVCGRRLKPFLPELVGVLERHGELVLEAEVKNQVEGMSAVTIDRLLRPYRQAGSRRPFGTTKPGSLLKAAIPIRTFTEWDERRPGFLEIDLVAHCGESTEGFYLNTLSTVDVATGWLECRGVHGKGQERVGGTIHHVNQRLPFPLLGIDSDNGSEFINQRLYGYCQQKGTTFTRSRPYKRNDSAHVEQKNWMVRRLIGYDRYNNREALEQQLNRIYALVGRYVNFFQPVMQLQEKRRRGALVRKVYDTARTPYQRLLACGVLGEEQR